MYTSIQVILLALFAFLYADCAKYNLFQYHADNQCSVKSAGAYVIVDECFEGDDGEGSLKFTKCESDHSLLEVYLSTGCSGDPFFAFPLSTSCDNGTKVECEAEIVKPVNAMRWNSYANKECKSDAMFFGYMTENECIQTPQSTSFKANCTNGVASMISYSDKYCKKPAEVQTAKDGECTVMDGQPTKIECSIAGHAVLSVVSIIVAVILFVGF